MTGAIHIVPRDRKCRTCRAYGFKSGNPAGYRWTYCKKRKQWFSDEVDMPGDWKKCSDWE